jgi:hypothetical protein
MGGYGNMAMSKQDLAYPALGKTDYSTNSLEILRTLFYKK